MPAVFSLFGTLIVVVFAAWLNSRMLSSQIDALPAEMDTLRAEVHGEIAAVRAEMEVLRAEMRQGFADLRLEFHTQISNLDIFVSKSWCKRVKFCAGGCRRTVLHRVASRDRQRYLDST